MNNDTCRNYINKVFNELDADSCEDTTYEEIMDLVLTRTIHAYNHNLPDVLELIIQITFRNLSEQTDDSKEVMQNFRDMAHDIIDLN
jgi:hypothetical protein